MAIGKNKKSSKGGRKGGKKKVIDPFARKEWYDIKVPNVFTKHVIGKTLVNKSAGTKLAKDALKGRVFESFVADLHQKDSQTEGFRKMRLRCEYVQGSSCLTQFHGMSITTDKLRSLIKKWQTLIEVNTDVKTADGYVLRVFMIGFTRKFHPQTQKTAYAQSQQVRQIRKKMVEGIRKKFQETDIRQVIENLQTDQVRDQITRECRSIYPLKDVFIRKVKVVKAPKVDVGKLVENFYSGTVDNTAAKAVAESTGAATAAPAAASTTTKAAAPKAEAATA